MRDAAQLAWVVNLGCIDLNPHPVRAGDLEHPDELRVDLDPVPGVEWDADPPRRARRRARCSRDHGLAGWPKTSGSRGIHVYARIEPRWTFTEVRAGGARARARGGAARAAARDEQVVEGGAARRLRRLQPEREGPHRRLGVLGAAHARRARVGAASPGTSCRPASRPTSRSAPCRRGSLGSATWAPASTTRRARLEPLLELVGAPARRGAGRRAVAAALREGRGRAPARRALAAQGSASAPDASARRGGARGEEGGRARGARTMEGAPPRGRRATRARGRARGRDARPLHHLDPRSREPAARARDRASSGGAARPRFRSVEMGSARLDPAARLVRSSSSPPGASSGAT